jgi:hypothetical protein
VKLARDARRRRGDGLPIYHPAAGMTLLMQIAAVVAAGVAVSALVRRLPPRGLAQGAAMAAVGVATVLGWHQGWIAAKQLDAGRRAPKLDRTAADVYAGRQSGVNVDFLAWVAARIPPGGSYTFVPRLGAGTLEYQWGTYQLTPRRLIDPRNADYLVFLGVDPRTAEYPRAAFDRPQRFASGFAIARRRGAG